jgi:hypothetical protein
MINKSFPAPGEPGSRESQLISLLRNQRSMAEQSATSKIKQSKQNKHAAGSALARPRATNWGWS